MAENQSSRIFLVAAVVLGVMATVMAFSFINSSANQDRGPKVRIVTAKHDLRAYESLEPERDFQVEEIPAKYAAFANRTVAPTGMMIYRGQKLSQPVKTGQPVFLADLASGGEFDVKEPYRLVTIAANPGLVVCGDYVKVANTSGKALAGGQAFRVVAVGGIIRKYRNPATVALEGDAGSKAKTVSLELTEEQGLELFKELSPSADRNFLIICPQPTTKPGS